jgi:hypothetical protein
MKAHALAPALTLAALLLVAPLAEAGQRHGRGHDGYQRHRQPAYSYNYRPYRPYARGHRYAPPVYGYSGGGYGYGGYGAYYGYGGYGVPYDGYYGYYPPPPPYRARPRFGIGIYFGF